MAQTRIICWLKLTLPQAQLHPAEFHTLCSYGVNHLRHTRYHHHRQHIQPATPPQNQSPSVGRPHQQPRHSFHTPFHSHRLWFPSPASQREQHRGCCDNAHIGARMAWGLPDKSTLHFQRLLTEAALYSHIPPNSRAAEQPKQKKHQTYFKQPFPGTSFKDTARQAFCLAPLARTGIQTTKKAAVTATAQRCKAKCSALGLLHSRFCQDCSSTEVCQPDRQHRCTTEPQIPQERRIHRLQRPWDIGEHCFLNPRTPSQQHAAPLPRTSRLSCNR